MNIHSQLQCMYIMGYLAGAQLLLLCLDLHQCQAIQLQRMNALSNASHNVVVQHANDTLNTSIAMKTG